MTSWDHHLMPKTEPKNEEVHAYLAGPDVFFPDAVARGETKKALLKEKGIVGHFPFDNEVDIARYLTRRKAGMAIGAMNEKMMRDCLADGQIAVIYANMSPWRSPSTDPGTAFEIGYFSALADFYPGRVLIMGYYDDPKDFVHLADRVGRTETLSTDEHGILRGTDGRAVENFDMRDNLMIEQACQKTNGLVCQSFEEAVAVSKALINAKKQELNNSDFVYR